MIRIQRPQLLGVPRIFSTLCSHFKSKEIPKKYVYISESESEIVEYESNFRFEAYAPNIQHYEDVSTLIIKKILKVKYSLRNFLLL